MVTNTGETTEGVLSWHEKTVQWLLHAWTSEMAMFKQKRLDKLERLCRPPEKVRKVRSQDVWRAQRGCQDTSPARRRPKGVHKKSRKNKNDDGSHESNEGYRHEIKTGPSKGKAQKTTSQTCRQERARKETKKVIWWNVAEGLAAKHETVKEIINKENPVLFFIFESNTRSNKSNKHLGIQGYDFVTSESDFSRTACYIQKEKGLKVVSQGEGNEVIVVENDQVRIMGVYMPFRLNPGESLMGNFTKLLTFLNAQCKTKKILMIAGDFNVDLSKGKDITSSARALEEWATENGLTQKIKTYTRKRCVNTRKGIRNEQSILDHFYTNDDRIKCRTVEQCMSDHFLLESTLDLKTETGTLKMTRRDWRRYNPNSVMHFCNNKGKEDLATIEKTLSSQFVDGESLLSLVNNFHLRILNELAPERVVKTRRNTDIVDSKVNSIKKKRDRLYLKYKKTGDEFYLNASNALTKEMKKEIRSRQKKKYETKANTQNPKAFWSVINEINGNHRNNDTIRILQNGNLITNSKEVANVIADAFENKVLDLVKKTGKEMPKRPDLAVADTSTSLSITMEMVKKAIQTLKRKKSSGIDGVPMIIVRDTFSVLSSAYRKIFQLATIKIPGLWKMSLVRPLHKSGDKCQALNYRPISNLCSLEKVFEKIILFHLDSELGITDGPHQHGYKSGHSTTTAALTVQSMLAERMDKKLETIMYSLDLSAAFDMLRVDKFHEMLQNKIPQNVMSILVDFLTSRQCVVEVDGNRSSIRDVPLGCVQGSVLGPRLFSLYTSMISELIPGKIISYADDSYVLVSTVRHEDVVCETERCLVKHVQELRNLGMVVNEKKTEAVYFKRGQSKILEINCGNEKFSTGKSMKVLGIIFSEDLKWDLQIQKTISKTNRLTNGLRFLRRKLSRNQFIKATTSMFYGQFYYGSQVWLGEHTTNEQLRRLNTVHYRILRIVEGDWKKEKRRWELDQIGRAKPLVWSKYTNANLATKIMNEKSPTELYERMAKNCYHERRKPRHYKFYDSSSTKVGSQAFENRLGNLFNQLDFEQADLSRDALRISLKRCLKMLTA